MSKSLRPSDSRWSSACRPAISFLAAGLGLAPKALSAELLPPGFRPLPLGVHALAGGTVVIKPGWSPPPFHAWHPGGGGLCFFV